MVTTKKLESTVSSAERPGNESRTGATNQTYVCSVPRTSADVRQRSDVSSCHNLPYSFPALKISIYTMTDVTQGLTKRLAFEELVPAQSQGPDPEELIQSLRRPTVEGFNQ